MLLIEELLGGAALVCETGLQVKVGYRSCVVESPLSPKASISVPIQEQGRLNKVALQS